MFLKKYVKYTYFSKKSHFTSRYFISTISDMISLRFTVFPCKFNSPEVKWNLIFSVISFFSELPHNLLNELKLKDLFIPRHFCHCAGLSGHTRKNERKKLKDFRKLGNEKKSQYWVETQAIVSSLPSKK